MNLEGLLSMKYIIRIMVILGMVINVSAETVRPETIRIATFNASMDGSNYVERGQRPKGDELALRLAHGNEQQIKNVAEIIQIVRPDILLINEFDYIADPKKGVEKLLSNYLGQSQSGQKPIEYSYYFVAPVNTGVATGLDLDKDGVASDIGADAFGFGFYPGQYGMVLLSRFPIQVDKVRTFQNFLWKDMPGSLLPLIRDEKNQPWYNEKAQSILRLSSKSHWDVPIKVGEKEINILASHPTPPVFDGKENRNGKRNHDEVRFWVDYLNGKDYFYDDQGNKGKFAGTRFVVLGDLNASFTDGDSYGASIYDLAKHEKVNFSLVPQSEGGKQARLDNKNAATHTAGWGMRADYVLPSNEGFDVKGGEVFWPNKGNPHYRLIKIAGVFRPPTSVG